MLKAINLWWGEWNTKLKLRNNIFRSVYNWFGQLTDNLKERQIVPTIFHEKTSHYLPLLNKNNKISWFQRTLWENENTILWSSFTSLFLSFVSFKII